MSKYGSSALSSIVAVARTTSALAFGGAQRSQEISRDNGIRVGRVNRFDQRALQDLTTISKSLQAVSFLNAEAVEGVMTYVQDSTVESRFSSFTLLAGCSPKIEDKTTTSGMTSDSTKTGDRKTTTDHGRTSGSENTLTKTTEAQNLTAPTLPTAPFALSSTLAFGPSASDLPPEQVALTFRVFNLQSLLDQAVSDRVLVYPVSLRDDKNDRTSASAELTARICI